MSLEVYQKALLDLGMSQEDLTEMAKENANVNAFTTKAAEKIAATHFERSKSTLLDDARKEANTSVYKIAEKALFDNFPDVLKEDDFKEVTQGRYKAMVNKVKESLTELAGKKASSDEDKKAIERFNEQIKALQAEKAEFEAFKIKAEQEKQAIKDEFFQRQHVGEHWAKTLAEVKDKTVDLVDGEMIKLLFDNMASIKAIQAADGKVTFSITDKQGKPYAKTPSANYENLSDFVETEILAKKNWLKKQEGPKNPAVGGNTLNAAGTNKDTVIKNMEKNGVPKEVIDNYRANYQ